MKVRNVRRRQAERYLRRMPWSLAYLVPPSVFHRVTGGGFRRRRRAYWAKGPL